VQLEPQERLDFKASRDSPVRLDLQGRPLQCRAPQVQQVLQVRPVLQALPGPPVVPPVLQVPQALQERAMSRGWLPRRTQDRPTRSRTT